MQNLCYRDGGRILPLPLGGETVIRKVRSDFFAYLESYRAYAIRVG